MDFLYRLGIICAANLLAILPIAFWVYLFLRKDRINPEPKKWLIGCFAAGMLIAPIIIGYETFLINNSVYLANLPVLTFRAIVVLGGAAVEEIVKFLIIYIILRYNPYFDEPMDAVIYLVMGAAGFALVENVMVSAGLIGDRQTFLTIFSTLFGRFIGANLLHILTASLIGLIWGLLAKRNIGWNKSKKGIAIGLLAGILIHTIFNFFVFTYSASAMTYLSLWLLFFIILLMSELKKLDISDSLFFRSRFID